MSALRQDGEAAMMRAEFRRKSLDSGLHLSKGGKRQKGGKMLLHAKCEGLP